VWKSSPPGWKGVGGVEGEGISVLVRYQADRVKKIGKETFNKAIREGERLNKIYHHHRIRERR